MSSVISFESLKMVKNQFYQNKKSWINSFESGISKDEHGKMVPWMTYLAIEFLQNHISKNHTIFEFGSGASTVFFASKAARVVAVETNKHWLEIAMSNFSFHPNVEVKLILDGIENPNYELSAINDGRLFDFIIIDSIKRFDCALNSIDALKDGGAIILDDSQRKSYKKIFDLMEKNGFRRQDFIGIAPGQITLKNTTFFWKQNFSINV